MTDKEKEIEDLRKELEGKAGELGELLHTSEEAALDYLNRIDPNAVGVVFAAWDEIEKHRDEMKTAADALKAEADRVRTTLPQEAEAGKISAAQMLDAILNITLHESRDGVKIAKEEGHGLFDEFLPKAEEYLDLFEKLHPITTILRRKYNEDEERKKQIEAIAHLLGLIADDGKKGQREPGQTFTYTTYVKTITKEDLEACAEACWEVNRTSWGEQFADLAKVWDTYNTATRKKALKDELTVEKRLTLEASAYLYRCIIAKNENKPLATTTEGSTLPALKYITHENEVTAGISKLNSIFGFLDLVPADGQTRLDIQTDKDKDGNQLFTFYSATFEGGGEITYSRPLDARDDWYISFAGLLYEEGQTVFSKRQFYKKIFKTDPSKAQLAKFSEAIELMMRTQVQITNDIIDETEEGTKLIGDAATDRPKYPTRQRTKFSYKGALLPCEIVEATDPHTGKVIKDAVHIFRYPPTLEYAKTRGEIMTLDPELLLVAGVSWTPKTAALHKMLLTRIAQLKRQEKLSQMHRHTSPKYLKDTLYDQCHIRTATDKKNVKRAGTVEKILEHYKEKGHIKGWKETEDSFTITV